jgi:hypothetical protein
MYAALYHKRHYMGNLLMADPISGLKIKTSEICKLFDRGQKSFHEIVLLGAVKRIDEIMEKCTFSNQVTRNRKVD